MSINPVGREAAAQDLIPQEKDPVPRFARTGLSVHFYHLTTTPLERALPKLVEKAYSAGHRVLLIDSLAERRDMLNQTLWTYSTLAFLPHGMADEPEPERQPILLAASPENLNRADIALVVDGTEVTDIQNFSRVIDLFDGQDAVAVQNARTRWTRYQAAGLTLSYLKQTDAGGWETVAL